MFNVRLRKIVFLFRPVKKPPKTIQERADQAGLQEVNYLNSETKKLVEQVMDDLKLKEKQKMKIKTFTSGTIYKPLGFKLS